MKPLRDRLARAMLKQARAFPELPGHNMIREGRSIGPGSPLFLTSAEPRFLDCAAQYDGWRIQGNKVLR